MLINEQTMAYCTSLCIELNHIEVTLKSNPQASAFFFNTSCLVKMMIKKLTDAVLKMAPVKKSISKWSDNIPYKM